MASATGVAPGWGRSTIAGPARPDALIASRWDLRAYVVLDRGVTAHDQPARRSADELLDIVDKNDQVIGTARREVAYAQRLRHRCVFVLARDRDGRVFVHRRTDRKLVFPSHYDMFVGGVVGAGESYDQAALREAEEELGVTDLEAPTPLFAFLYETPEHTWWSSVYEVRCDPPVHPQAEEVAWHAFLTEGELQEKLAVWTWTPDGLEAYRRLVAWRG
jgi:isopentenyldiphosphate isomerase